VSKTVTHIPTPGTELLYHLKDAGRYVYHYTRVNTFLDKILPTSSLRLSPYTCTNDPKESKAWRFNASVLNSQKHSFDDWPSDELNARMNKELKERTNVVCFSSDGPLTGDHTRDIHSRGWCKPRMWAQYGQNHEGICLVFDRTKLETALKATFEGKRPMAIGRVEYCDRMILERLDDPTYVVLIDELARLGWDRYIEFHLKHSHRRLFFEKNADWSTESEYRCVVWGGDGEPAFVNYGDSLRGIMFGASASDETIETVYAATHHLGVFAQQLVWQGCTPWYALDRSFSWEIRFREKAHASAS
jgi:hypothetical protein